MYKIMVLEDDPMVRSINKQYVDNFMKKKDYTVICMDNSIEALEVIKAEKVDLILLDIYMPQMTGLELLTELSKKGIHPQVIMLTAASDTPKIGEAINYGVLDYLIKPFTYKRFSLAMEKFIQVRYVFQHQKSDSQEEVDKLFYSEQTDMNHHDLPKGLSAYSLSSIEEIASHINARFSTQDIAHLTKLSRVSVKKYLDYLLSIDKISVELEYSKVGRPTYIYAWNDIS